MTKEQIIENIISVSENLRLQTETKYKCKNWNADVLVTYQTYKVAFNICKTPRKIEETYKIMRKDRVCGCWLLMPSNTSYTISQNLPCFKLTEDSANLYVTINSNIYNENNCEILNFDTFISNLIKGNIRFTKSIIVKYIEVCFIKIKCWNCNKINNIYFINRYISSDGISVSCDDFQLDGYENYNYLENLEFNPTIINAIENYIKKHPTKNLIMGKIKSRYSNTMKTSYMSFGCAFCDKLFGKFYIQEVKDEIIYSTDLLQKEIIEIPQNFSIPANKWYKKI